MGKWPDPTMPPGYGYGYQPPTTPAGTTLYQGQITAIENGSRLRMSAVLNATSGSGNAGQIQLQMVLLLSSGQVSGTVQGTPSATGLAVFYTMLLFAISGMLDHYAFTQLRAMEAAAQAGTQSSD